MTEAGPPVSPRQLQIGIVGLGFGARIHIPAFQADPRCAVMAVCASRPERAREIAQRLRISRAIERWQELVADPAIDIVAIATPPASQPEIAIAAFEHGKYVLCEKPLANTLDAARRVLAAAHRAGTAHAIDFEFPLIPSWERAKDLLDAGGIGRMRHAVISWQAETYASRTGLESWKTRPEEGGGVLNAFGSHVLYHVEWMLGRIRRISARLRATADGVANGAGEHGASLWLELLDGTPVSVSINSDARWGSGHRMELYGDAGTLRLENDSSDYVRGFRLLYGGPSDRVLHSIPASPEAQGSSGDGRLEAVTRFVRRFIDGILGAPSSYPSLEDGYRVQCLLDAARCSHESGTWIGINLPEAIPAQGTAFA